MKLATWNINSLNVRLPQLLDWLQANPVDAIGLQELKLTDDKFPFMELEAAGYQAVCHGQKTYNGVAILSKRPIEDVRRGLPGDDSDEQARYIEAVVDTVRVASIYLPNGNPLGTEKFPYKLAWMDRLVTHASSLLQHEEALVLGGDYNVCPLDMDCYDPPGFADDALCQPESRNRFRQMLHLGLTDAFRALHPQRIAYSYWDYTGGAWQKDNGVRIDHLLLSPQAADRLEACDIDKSPRGRERPSDHTPVWCELEEG